MGRPPKDPNELAEERVTARFTADEKRMVDKLAVQLRLTAAGVVRRAVRELYDRVFDKGRE